MAMAAPAGGLEAKHYILAALTATLVAAGVVTVTSVVLSPARISFSVTEARTNNSQLATRGGGQQLLLTLAADNPSRRAAVQYQSMFVDVSNNTGLQWAHWVKADLETAMPLRQPPRNVTEIHATARLVGGPFTEDFTANRTSHSFSVRVTATARFKVGVAWTRLYDIRVYCGNVDFFANKSSTADCHAA
jgi:hypothetical protein